MLSNRDLARYPRVHNFFSFINQAQLEEKLRGAAHGRLKGGEDLSMCDTGMLTDEKGFISVLW